MKKIFQTLDGAFFESEDEALVHEFNQGILIIVDDDPAILDIVSRKLHNAKIKHRTFQDPLEAMNFISKNNIFQVFTDYHMKNYGMSGKWIKEICGQYGIKCSIVSGDESITDINKFDFVRNCISFIKI